MATKKAASKSKTASKPTKRKVNKTAEIRKYFDARPQAKTATVVAALKKRGIVVTANYVSNVKSTSKSKPASKKTTTTKKKTTGKKQGTPTSAVEDVKQAGSLMFQAIDLVMKAGAKEAKAMVEMAGKMVDRISDDEK